MRIAPSTQSFSLSLDERGVLTYVTYKGPHSLLNNNRNKETRRPAHPHQGSDD